VPNPAIPEKAVEAAIATSTTWPIRNDEEKAKYRKRVETLLEAALPTLQEAIAGPLATALDDLTEAVGRVDFKGQVGDVEDLDSARHAAAEALATYQAATQKGDGR